MSISILKIFNKKANDLTGHLLFYAKISTGVDSMENREKVLELFEKVIKEGAYPNMRMLRNDIEDAINFEILKARGIIQ